VTLFSFVFLLLRDDAGEQILISRFRNQKSVQVHVDKMMPSGMRHNAPDARGGAIVGGNQRHTLACYLIDSIRHCDRFGLNTAGGLRPLRPVLCVLNRHQYPFVTMISHHPDDAVLLRWPGRTHE